MKQPFQNSEMLSSLCVRPKNRVRSHFGSVETVSNFFFWREMLPARKRSGTTLELPVACLNIGGRNTNPLEFILEGDDSDLGVQALIERFDTEPFSDLSVK